MFGFPGGVLLPLYDILPQYPQIHHVLVRHEQGAAHAADGYARATGKVGVCIATSGPGATNLVTGIANAYLDSVPMVAFTGQVIRALLGKDAFQEADITGITLPITKHNYLVLDTADLASIIKEAFYLARTGRPGPVLIDIPKDVFTDEVEFNYPDQVIVDGYKPLLEGHSVQIKRAAKLIKEAQRPLLIAGRGTIISSAFDELKELAEKAQIPVATTLLGVSSFPVSHVLSLGMLGMHGTAYANLAVSEADLVIAVGMRFDDRATARVDAFAPKAKIIHIDIDPAEIGKNVRVDVPIVGDVKNVLQSLNKLVPFDTHIEWVSLVQEWQQKYPLFPKSNIGLLPQYIIKKISEITGCDATVVTGVGQHQMWSAQFFCYDKPNSFVSSGGLGTMGFELPAALGVKIGCPDETVWCIAGDGSLQMTSQELATAVQENAAVKIAVMNNGFLGMVRQWQQFFYGGRYVATPISGPDFVKLAEAYGIAAIQVKHKRDVASAIRQALAHDGPFLIDFLIEPEENVYPMVAPGESLMALIHSSEKKIVSAVSKKT